MLCWRILDGNGAHPTRSSVKDPGNLKSVSMIRLAILRSWLPYRERRSGSSILTFWAASAAEKTRSAAEKRNAISFLRTPYDLPLHLASHMVKASPHQKLLGQNEPWELVRCISLFPLLKIQYKHLISQPARTWCCLWSQRKLQESCPASVLVCCLFSFQHNPRNSKCSWSSRSKCKIGCWIHKKCKEVLLNALSTVCADAVEKGSRRKPFSPRQDTSLQYVAEFRSNDRRRSSFQWHLYQSVYLGWPSLCSEDFDIAMWMYNTTSLSQIWLMYLFKFHRLNCGYYRGEAENQGTYLAFWWLYLAHYSVVKSRNSISISVALLYLASLGWHLSFGHMQLWGFCLLSSSE